MIRSFGNVVDSIMGEMGGRAIVVQKRAMPCFASSTALNHFRIYHGCTSCLICHSATVVLDSVTVIKFVGCIENLVIEKRRYTPYISTFA